MQIKWATWQGILWTTARPREELGDYIYRTRKAGKTPDENKLQEYCAKIDVHQAEIEKLEADAKLSGQVISDKLSREDEA